jgi:GNAT superfamily N-acetyltransferase
MTLVPERDASAQSGRIIEPLRATEVAAGSALLARAFVDNPGLRALLPDDPQDARLALIRRCMHGFAEATRRHGTAEVVKEQGELAAVSLAFPPGGFPPPLRAQLIIAFGPLLAGPRRAMRFARFDAQLRRRHPRDPHWYLWVLGVEPERQGRGLGSALLRSLGARADRAGVPCYLETDRPSSVRLYERHGYAVLNEETLPELGTPLWFMRRERSSTGSGT